MNIDFYDTLFYPSPNLSPMAERMEAAGGSSRLVELPPASLHTELPLGAVVFPASEAASAVIHYCGPLQDNLSCLYFSLQICV